MATRSLTAADSTDWRRRLKDLALQHSPREMTQPRAGLPSQPEQRPGRPAAGAARLASSVPLGKGGPSSVRPLSAPTSLAIREALLRLLSGQDLTRLQMTQAMEALLAGEATPAQVGALAAILRLKRETDEELAAALETCRARLPKIPHTRTPLLACATAGSESLHAKDRKSVV